MIKLSDWVDSAPFPQKPWLIVGKGPSYAHIGKFDLGEFNVMVINDVVREVRADVALAADIEVVMRCGDVLERNCDWLIMPSRPNANWQPGPLVLSDYVEKLPVLRELDQAGRLVYYDMVMMGSRDREWYFSDAEADSGSRIKVRRSSSEIAVSIVALLGDKTVRTLGIDGGSTYSQAFKDLTPSTMLSAGNPSFDMQFERIKAIVEENNLDYAPLVEPIRVFVGCDESQLVAAGVLEHTIRKFSTRPVQFNRMMDLLVPVPKDKANRQRTGFSFYRFMIPSLCGYKGQALYLDADMQVFADLAELWDIPFGRHKVLCTYHEQPPPAWKDHPEFRPGRHMAVMKLDCSRLDWDINEIVRGLDEGRYSYYDLMSDMVIVPPDEIGEIIPPEWNSLEHYEPGKTKLVHYTIVATQPWKTDKNPLVDLWMADYRDAMEHGAIDKDLVKKAIAKDLVKASLADGLELGSVPDALALRLKSLLRRARRRVRVWALGTRILRKVWRSWVRLSERRSSS